MRGAFPSGTGRHRRRHKWIIVTAAWLACSSVLPACRQVPITDWKELKAHIRASFPQVPQISTAELAGWLADADSLQPMLIDARKPEEFEVSHLAGAKRAGSLEEALVVLSGEAKDRPIVVYCSVGYRSSKLADKLIGKGFTRVYNLEGSIFEWANEGRPVYSHGKRVRRVHPYDAKWGRLLDEELRYDKHAGNE